VGWAGSIAWAGCRTQTVLARPTEGATLTDTTPDPIPAELAPFLADAQSRLASATEGLQPAEAIEHLQTTVARAEFEASRLGIRFDPLADGDALGMADGNPVVVIRRLIETED
jgi:hypothetical protein